MPSFAAITKAAAEWAEGFEPNRLTAAPTRHIVVLACMDARLDLFRLLGLQVGDAHIVRNAGGRATQDAIRSIIVSANALDTREVVVVHHSGCGLCGVTNADLRQRVRDTTGHDPTDVEFFCFDDVEQSVREDVGKLRDCPYLPPGMSIWGAWYDVATGVLHPVDRDA